MNTSSSFTGEKIWPFWTVSGSDLLTYYKPLQQEIWLAVYSRSNLIGVKYIHLSMTHWPIHRPITYSTRRLRSIFFYKNITQKFRMRRNTWIFFRIFSRTRSSLFCPEDKLFMKCMDKLSFYARKRIVNLRLLGINISQIVWKLTDEDSIIS